MKRYVCGFMFNDVSDGSLYERVALIHKQRPEWQKGRLNGIGGHIRDGESPHQAMRREFLEEAGYDQEKWNYFLTLKGKDYEVEFFHCNGPLDKLRSATDEKVEIVHLRDINIDNFQIIPNLLWIIFLALDNKRGLTGCGVKHTLASEI